MYPLIAAITYPLLQTCLNGIYIGDVCRSLPKEIAIFNKVWGTSRFSTGWNEIIIAWSCTLVLFTDSREFLRGSPPCSKPRQQSGKCPGFRVVPFLSTMTVKSHTLFTSPCLVWWPQNFTAQSFVVCLIGWPGWIFQPAPVLCQPQCGWQVGWKWESISLRCSRGHPLYSSDSDYHKTSVDLNCAPNLTKSSLLIGICTCYTC